VQICHRKSSNVGPALEDSNRDDRVFSDLGFPYHEENQYEEPKDDQADDKSRVPGREPTRTSFEAIQEADGAADDESEADPVKTAHTIDERLLFDIDLEKKEECNQSNAFER
jgi:hypothetical protein